TRRSSDLPDSSSASSTYSGFVTTLTNAKSQTKTETRNAQGELVRVVDHLGGWLSQGYDAQGNLTSTVDHGGNLTSLSYDLLGRKTAMNDPDKGAWSYQYNGFGELTLQTDAKGQTSTLTHDGLGRLVTRVDRLAGGASDGNTTWTYDSAANSLGQLASVQDTVSGYIKLVEYDQFGRPGEAVTSLGIGGSDGDHYEKVTYDQFGRTFQRFDAARDSASYTDNGVEHRYNAYGHLEQLVDAVYTSGQPRATYRTITSMDARGNVTGETLGNNVATSRTFDVLGRLDKQTATNLVTWQDPQNLDYDWDSLGNLDKRRDLARNLTETFAYDGLNRLTSASVTGQTGKTYRYDGLGNLLYKSDVCPTTSNCYSYGAGSAGPHAVTSVAGSTYAYDANGNNTSGDGRTLTYTSYDLVSSVTKGSHQTTFSYGPDRARTKRVDSNRSE